MGLVSGWLLLMGYEDETFRLKGNVFRGGGRVLCLVRGLA